MAHGSWYRSHFGSRYHTRADAVTQAFLHRAISIPSENMFGKINPRQKHHSCQSFIVNNTHVAEGV